jgi:hypothetical protein
MYGQEKALRERRLYALLEIGDQENKGGGGGKRERRVTGNVFK